MQTGGGLATNDIHRWVVPSLAKALAKHGPGAPKCVAPSEGMPPALFP